MKEKILIYKGFHDPFFIFNDESEKPVQFIKCRRELIDDFKLKEKQSINQRFKVRYFGQEHDFETLWIITDLSEVN